MTGSDGAADASSPLLIDEVYERLMAMILSDDLPPDVRVNVYALAKRLDVSPTPIREALTRLEDARLVEKIHLKGYRTTSVLTRKELTDLYDLRLLLEPPSAALAADRAGDDEIASLRQEVHRFTEAPEAESASEYSRFSRHDARLHGLIARASGNLAVERALERTHFHLHAFRLAYDHESGETTVLEHIRIVEAIEARDAPRAEIEMRAHLETARERLLLRTQ